jgi:hypothetical protein
VQAYFSVVIVLAATGLVAVMIRPSLFAGLWPGAGRGLLSLIVVGMAGMLALFGLPLTLPTESAQPKASNVSPSVTRSQSPSVSPSSPSAKAVSPAPKYTIVHELSKKRYDGGLYEYVLIEPVSLKDGSYKSQVRSVIRDLVAKKGGKISIELHDREDSLDISFKQYGDLSLGHARTAEENAIQAIHFIAHYTGQMSSNPLPTLGYFPNALKSDPNVGQFVGDEDFDPGK